MSVPKFRNSRSRVRRRRAHHALKPVHVVIDKETGEPRLPHHAKPSDTAKLKAETKLAKEVVKEIQKKESASEDTQPDPVVKTDSKEEKTEA